MEDTGQSFKEVVDAKCFRRLEPRLCCDEALHRLSANEDFRKLVRSIVLMIGTACASKVSPMPNFYFVLQVQSACKFLVGVSVRDEYVCLGRCCVAVDLLVSVHPEQEKERNWMRRWFTACIHFVCGVEEKIVTQNPFSVR